MTPQEHADAARVMAAVSEAITRLTADGNTVAPRVACGIWAESGGNFYGKMVCGPDASNATRDFASRSFWLTLEAARK